ncbi:MAG: hypothetical protein OEN56_05020 [Gemmatimonadota bacterium]|nr:hypothetical protein [Gemmatimonadota bacterium]
MEELIFFAVIIFFSILESIARTRRAKKGGDGGEERSPLPDPREPGARLPDFELERAGQGGPTPDDEDLSYAEIATRKRRQKEDRTLERYTGAYGSEPDEPESEPPRVSSSEAMLPGDLLAQLEDLARSRQPQRRPQPRDRVEDARTLDLPTQSPQLPAPTKRREVGTRRAPSPEPRAPIREHVVHRAHAGYGTDPSSRAPSEQDGLDPLAERLGADASAAREQLRGLSRSALRQAIILQQVLGPPVTLRDETPSTII